MEAALMSVATGALKPVIGKLGALLGDEYKRFKGVRKDIKSLTRELAAMDAFLMKMSEEEDPDVQDKVWMNEVRELSYDMEDCIDDFMQSVSDKDAKPEGFIEKIKHSLGKMKARRRIGNEIEDLKKQITEVAGRNARYKTRQPYANTKNAAVDPRALVIFEDASKLVGIDVPKYEIIEKLVDKYDHATQQQQTLKIVSIVGSGGMGKTTLASQVYQDLSGKFECRAFLSVSRNPDMVNILRTIFSKVSGTKYVDTEAGSIQQLIGNINYFVVVDDIWDVDTWEVIKRSLPIPCKKDVADSYSIVITTTRKKDVADSCQSSFNGHIYNIRPLDMVHSRQLFHRRLFDNEENCPFDLEKVSKQILERCGGLPLAIIAISGLLANRERTEDIWNEVKDSIGRALERNTSIERMMKIISLSYFDLPPHLKSCLLYLSIFSEDIIIEKKGLIRWIAEGFIHKQGRYTVQDLGERCFNELVNRSLIQPVNIDRYGRVKTFRVHDTILDFITSKSIEENFVTPVAVQDPTIGTKNKVRRLSLQDGKKENSSLSTIMDLSHVRSISGLGYSDEIPYLGKSKYLRVLEFDGCHQFVNHHLTNVGRFFQLRHMNLRNTRVSELSEQIGYLEFLEMLDIRHTHVHKLPASIVRLRRLVYFLCGTSVIFPNGIANMEALEVLKRVRVFKQPFRFMQELSQLKNLKKVVLEFVANAMGVKEEHNKATESSLREVCQQNIGSLTICSDEYDFLGAPLFPAPVGLKLMAYEADLLQVPNWLGILVNLRELHLEVEGIRHGNLCMLGALPALLTLTLKVSKMAKGGLIVSGGVGFRRLRHLCYFKAQLGGMDLMFAAGSMPKLEKLEIEFHAAESDSLSADTCDFGIENLRCLTTLTCRIRGWLNSAVSAAKAALERTAETHPNHPTLLLA